MMKAFHNVLLFLLWIITLSSADVMVGDQVCMTGFIMDNFCIERGTLLDDGSVTTMRNPELHSYHCLLDVGVCINSGFQVLGDKDPVSGLHCPGLRVDDTAPVLKAGRAHGTTQRQPGFFSCSTCTGPNGNPIAGYRATIIGTVKELGNGMGRIAGFPGTKSVEETPILTNIQVLDSMVLCDQSMMVTVQADENNECLIHSAHSDGASNTGDDSSSSSPMTQATTNPAITATATTLATITTTDATTATTIPSAVNLPETTTPAAAAAIQDCSSGFCTTALTDGFTLNYKINEADNTISMEVSFEGETWLGIAFSKNERMGGSDGVM
jgi:hypothetical protein